MLPSQYHTIYIWDLHNFGMRFSLGKEVSLILVPIFFSYICVIINMGLKGFPTAVGLITVIWYLFMFQMSLSHKPCVKFTPVFAIIEISVDIYLIVYCIIQTDLCCSKLTLRFCWVIHMHPDMISR